MGNNNLDFDHGAFPLLSKDNSAVDPALLQVPMPIAMARKDMSAQSGKSKKSAFSLGFSKNV